MFAHFSAGRPLHLHKKVRSNQFGGTMRFVQNLRYAWRSLLRNRGLNVIILLTLALGIGANTAIFTVDYATLFAPLSYPQPEQLVTVWSGTNGSNPSPQTFVEWRKFSRTFRELSAFSGSTFGIANIDQPESVWGMRVTANYFHTLGSPFFLGRDFLPGEDQEGKNHVVILTHKLWSHLGADPKLVGHTMRIDGKPYTVVGVLQPGIADRDIFEMAMPLVFTPEELQHGSVYLVAIGRLKNGVSIQQAQDDVGAIMAHLAPSNPMDAQIKSTSVRPLREFMFSMSRDSRQTLWWLLGGVGFVLLIACVNVANLLLAKGMTRQREIAVRGALGATRRTIFWQLLTESLLLAMTGGLLGICLGYSMLRALLVAMPRFTLPWATDTHLSVPVLLFTLSTTMLAGLLFGCVPAWFASQTNPGEALKSGAQVGLGVGRHRLQQILVIGELALAISIVAGAGLDLHSFENLINVDMGVRTDHTLTFYLSVPKTQEEEPVKIASYYGQMLTRIQAVAGVSSASAQTGTPLFPPGMTPFAVAGESAPDGDSSKWPKAGIGAVTPDFFKTFGIQMMRGRAFTEHDSPSNLKVAIVNEEFVRRFLNGNDPLRAHVWLQQSAEDERIPATPTEWQIVGVSHDTLSKSMREHIAQIYIPFWQSPSSDPVIAVRTAVDPDSTIKSIGAAVHSVDSSAILARPRTMEEIRNQVLASDRFSMILFVSFGAIATLLATLGVYGLISFSVASRRSEIAVRMALGANRLNLVALVVRQGLSLAVTGLTLGLGGAYLLNQGMRNALFGIGRIDFAVLGGVALLLLIAALLACVAPAGRAASVEPMQALRTE
jgi:putative ABC transport system permease protein